MNEQLTKDWSCKNECNFIRFLGMGVFASKQQIYNNRKKLLENYLLAFEDRIKFNAWRKSDVTTIIRYAEKELERECQK